MLGLIGAYLADRYKAARAARLARIDRQLAEYYGPLLALASASNRTWKEFRRKYRPDGQFWSGSDQRRPLTQLRTPASDVLRRIPREQSPGNS